MIRRKEIIMKLYVAYGSNLDKKQMKYRCPLARPVQSGYLDNWQLIYRGSKTGAYASIRYKKGCRVPVGIWEITAHDEKFLDMYEGYPSFYQKKNIYVHLEDAQESKQWYTSCAPTQLRESRPNNTCVLYCADTQISTLTKII